MKTNNKLGFIAAALTALACALPGVARAAGDIWSIEPYQDAETVSRDFSTTKEQPLSVGDVFKIRVRLLNRYSDSTLMDDANSCPWTFKYVGTPGGEALAQMHMPKLGVWVSGMLKYAVLDGTPKSATPETIDRHVFTDVIFKYTVEAGDLALPIKLANPDGTGPIEVNADISGQYFLKDGRGVAFLEDWQLQNASNDVASLTFTDEIANPPLTPPLPNTSWDFTNPPIYIQAIDFDANYADEGAGVWREIASGLTSSTPMDPAVVIPGGNANSIDLFVWTKKSSVAEVIPGGDVISVTEQTDLAGNTYKVGRLRVPATRTGVSFKVEAKEVTGQTTDIYLSATPTNVYNASQVVLTNFITRTIKVVTPPPPFVSVSFAEGAPRAVVADGNFDAYKTVLQVGVSQTFTEDVSITLKPSLVNNAAGDPWRYIGLSKYDDASVYLQQETAVTIPAGSRTSAPIYLYALDADMWTRDLTNGILFQAQVNGTSAQAFYSGTPVDATLHIDVSKPVVGMPDAPYTGTSSIQSGETTVFSVEVADSYRNMTGVYDVFLNENNSFKGTETPIATGLAPVNGVLSVPYKFISTGLVTSRIKVRNAAGVESAVTSFEVNGLAPRTLKCEPADGNEDHIYAEGKDAAIRARFEPAFSLATEAYVFLEPQDEASSNKIESLNITRGVRIQNGQAESSVPIKLTLLDGTVSTETSGLRYKLKIRTAEVYDQGNEIEGYTSTDYNIFVTNVVPRASTVFMGGIWEPEEVDGKLVMGGQAAVGVRKVFTYVPADGEVNADLADGTFTAKWTFYDGAGYTTNVVGSPYDVEVPYTFVNGGRCRVTVELQDKDLREQGALKFGPKYEFYVNVVDTPSVELVPKSGSQSFLESEKGDKGVILVRLTMAPDAPVKVQLEVTRNGADNGNYPIPTLNTYEIEFPRGVSEKSFSLKDIDGTEAGGSSGDGYRITAKVITDAVNADGIKYSDLYLPATDFSIYISNEPPEIVMPDPSDTNVYMTTLAKEEIIRWRVKDVCPNDVAQGLTITIMNSEGAYSVFKTSELSGEYTNRFTASGGGKWVSVQVQDKDGGASVVAKKYFAIAAAKGVKLYPQHPFQGGGQSKLTERYLGAAGVGYGRVWAESDARPAIKAFRQTWSFTEGISGAPIHAYGYRVGDVDDGTMNEGAGYGLTSAGQLWEGTGAAYTYQNDRGLDSFFYAWIVDTADEGSDYVGVQSFAPQYGAVDRMRDFKLPEDEDDAESYPDSVIEALFSLEWRKADNLGDINQDGIPDFFAVGKSWDAGLLYQLAAQGEDGAPSAGGGDEIDTSDLKSAWKYNGDQDFLPAAFKYANPLAPLQPGWGPDPDTEFVAGYEIRGLHEGLNIKGISDPDFSEAETMALLCDYAASVAAAGGDAEAAGADREGALAWAKTTGWNLERMTDPTKADTDDDGLPDGFEYFFWYYAKAGTMFNGTWHRMTGSRFNPANPGEGTPISSEEIAAAFDPLQKRAAVQTAAAWSVKDFDHDGLTDLEEFYLGTNPVTWDSDGDGVSDFYEVMAGTDPLNYWDGVGGLYDNGKETANNKFNGNPDGDFMAYMESTNTFTIVKVWDDEAAKERVYGYPTLEGGIGVAADEDTGPASVWAVQTLMLTRANKKLADGSTTDEEKWDEVTYYTEEKPLLVTDVLGTTYLAADTEVWTEVKVGEDDEAECFLGAPEILPQGTIVVAVSDEAVEMSWALTSGFTGGVELFRYGSALNGVWVPVPVDGAWMKQEYDMMGNPAEQVFPVLSYEADKKIVYIHHQVYQMCGYDPRTGWYKDEDGYVAARWHAKAEGDSGLAVNTKPYTTRDEYLSLAYRYNVTSSTNAAGQLVTFPAGLKSEDMTANTVLIGGESMVAYMLRATKPTPDGVKTETETESGEGEDAMDLSLVAWDSDVHGADSDGDGIPDGWELYANLNPRDYQDATKQSIKIDGKELLDNDTLVPVQEYAGVDSCNAYSNVTSIAQNHPGVKSGWWNKFFPTDPLDADTDGDGLADGQEGSVQTGTFYCGRSVYVNTEMSFLYAAEDAGYETDMKTTCFRGGGLNPCTVDTDQDLLPDPWEWEFAGVVMNENGTPANPDKVKVSDADVKAFQISDRMVGVTAKGPYVTGGMDGTWKNDAYGVSVKDPVTDTLRDTDWDHDGLQNYQEYLVQSLRHLRYDDAETPLMGRYLQWDNTGIKAEMPFIGFIPMQAWDGEAFRQTCLKAGYAGTSTFDYGRLGYFARPPKAWDRLALSEGGKDCNNYSEVGYRVMLRPWVLLADSMPPDAWHWQGATGYASTDPRQWDSDNDGMDDYYELFHGLNPLLGSAVNPLGGNLTTSVGSWGVENSEYDRICRIYGGKVTSWCNAWTRWNAEAFAQQPNDKFDAMKYPWMIGTAECDADGDGLNNADESIFVNDTAPATSHTDPTPLWMTDSTSKNYASFVSQYYQLDPAWGPLADLAKLWDRTTLWIDGASDGQTRLYKFAFEENEGYDTDGDFVSDASEKVKRIQAPTDALDFADPARRQAMWFPGENSAVVSYKGTNLRPNAWEYDMLKQFTVEAWICPEQFGAEQVVLERVAYYDASTLSNNVAVLRRNFRIGIDETGHVFGEFQGKTADSGTARVVYEAALEAGKWTHVALSFDGGTLALYLDDNANPAALARGVSLIPANGINIRLQDAGSNTELMFSRLQNGYSTVPCAFLIGAAAVDATAIGLSKATTWDAYGSFFKGYVDEVRIWDGARTGEQIAADARKRYSQADVAAQRDAIFGQWKTGKMRATSSKNNLLDPELLQVYNFTTMPGAVDALDTITEPAGFAQGVQDNVRIDGQMVDLSVGWWSELPVRSTVYNNYAVLPRIQNAVAHLPLYDGSTWDSEFWSLSYGGVHAASETFPGMENPAYAFPNTANPYSSWNYCQERMYHLLRLQYLAGGVTDAASSNVTASVAQNASAALKYEFALRSGFVGTDDLIPLGGAYAKRTTEMWDGQGAADAWDQTGIDSDGDGLPDWWVYGVAMANYGADENLTWSTIINYKGVDMTAAEAYIRDLANGMLPGGDVDGTFSVMKVDSNNDGLPDWWQKVYALAGESALDDSDNDQLSNYAEYLLSECFTEYGFPRVDPTRTRTFAGEGQAVSDYFLKVGKMYLGEMFSDHDFIEDWWEDLYDVKYTSRFTFDGASDADEDGWSVFAEARAGSNPTRIAYMGVDATTIEDFPIPLVQMTAKYNGTQAVAGKNVIIQAYRMDDTTGKPDAVWQIAGSGADASDAQQEYLVGMNPMKTVDLNLGPGSVQVGTVRLQVKDLTRHYVSGTKVNGQPVVSLTYAIEPETATWGDEAVDMVQPGDADNGVIMDVQDGTIGTINYQTGDATIDFSKLTGLRFLNEFPINEFGTFGWDMVNLTNSYVKLTWKSKLNAQGFPQTFYLSRPEDPTAFLSRGRLREGKNMFVAFVDMDGNGAWTAGEPYGVVSDVDVGWSRVAPFSVEMTDTNPTVARIDLASNQGEEDFAAANANTDRGVRGSYYPNVGTFVVGTNATIRAATRVRVVRSLVNGEYQRNGASYNEVVLDRTLDLDAHPALTEAEVRADGKFDLDWDTLRTAWIRAHVGTANLTQLTNATYRVVLGDGSVSGEPGDANNNLAVLFVNAFEAGAQQTAATPVAPAGTVFAGQPTFSWRHDAVDATGKKIKDYPAFRLRVWKDKAMSELVYDSDVQAAPPRDAAGVYAWTAPIYADMMTPQGVVFATTNNYFWSVSMLDAKFMTPNTAETAQEFRMETSGLLGTLSDYGVIQAKVKYFGPVTKGMVRVQAFPTPDFTGVPAGEGWVQDVTTLGTTDALEVNAKILGVAPGTYYIRAFIDTEADAQRSAWESWGYANYRDTDRRDVFTPQPFTLKKGQIAPVVATVYIEDMDTDNDGLPDAYEMEVNGSLGAKSSPTGASFFTKVNPQLAETVEAYTAIGPQQAVARQYAAMTFLSALAASDAQALSAAGMLLGDAEAPVAEKVTVAIASFSLQDGIAIEVGTEVAAKANDFVTVADAATVSVVLVAAETPDFARAKSVTIKDLVIRANAVSKEVVTAAELAKAIADNDLAGSAFFKVKLIQK